MSGRWTTALAVALRHWPLILVAGLGSAIAGAGLWRDFWLLLVIVVVAARVVACGRIAADLTGDGEHGARALLARHLVDFLLAHLVIGVPAAALRFVLIGLQPSATGFVLGAWLIGLVFGLLAMYALPAVFLTRRSLSAVLAGIVFLFRHPRASLGIGGVVALASLLGAVGGLVFRAHTEAPAFTLLLVVGVTGVFLQFLAFAAAAVTLLAVESDGSSERASSTG